ncbi:MAG TPA: polysaccharide deacetylase family protein [Streptosporangiaceae bacterium]|jgi:peptidoglycan/xylan/chitin deacetylase (PgdA/CDA1 family)
MTETVPVLMYHALSTARTADFHRWTLSAERLARHLEFLAREGYRTLTISSLAELLSKGGPRTGERLIALTFDDAYADFGEVALPMLTRYRMTATLFAPTGYVGGSSGWMCGEGEGDRPILSWTELTEIAAAGIEIGAHSHTHPQLDRVTTRELTAQVTWPKAELERRLGQPVRSFAYPYGRYSRRVRDAVAAAGYSAACTMNSWAATAGSHPLELPRTPVFHHMDAAELAECLAASRGSARRTALRAKGTALRAKGTARRAALAPARTLRAKTARRTVTA